MFRIKAIVDTYLKKEPIPALELTEIGQLHPVEAGKEYLVKRRLKRDLGHSKLALDYDAGTWWVFDEHWEEIKDTQPEVEEVEVGNEAKVESEDTRMELSDRGLAFIKGWEGLRLEAYRDVAGVLTIGYGHTKSVKPGQKITEKEAERLLAEDLKVYVDCVNELVSVPLSQSQFDALVSFTFNCGCNALKTSTLLLKLNKGDYDGAKSQLRRWNKAGGIVVQGLVNRRFAEIRLFESLLS